jgi:hypothetical protein
MSVREETRREHETRAVIDHYFDLMGRGEDFAICYADDVRWTTFDGGPWYRVRRRFGTTLNRLHQNMPDIQTRPLAYGAETAYIEGDWPIRAMQAPIA